MKPYKVKAHIQSLDGKMAEVTVITQLAGENRFVVDYNGIKCTAIYNWFNCTFYADDVYGVISK